jgi:hypothetical protein
MPELSGGTGVEKNPGPPRFSWITKNPGLLEAGIRFLRKKLWLSFSHRDGPRRADLYAALTAQALVLGYHDCFFILHFKDAGRTNVDAFFVTGAFVDVHFHTPRHKCYLL